MVKHKLQRKLRKEDKTKRVKVYTTQCVARFHKVLTEAFNSNYNIIFPFYDICFKDLLKVFGMFLFNRIQIFNPFSILVFNPVNNKSRILFLHRGMEKLRVIIPFNYPLSPHFLLSKLFFDFQGTKEISMGFRQLFSIEIWRILLIDAFFIFTDIIKYIASACFIPARQVFL